jgi:5-methylcytosine-specific restriction protein A
MTSYLITWKPDTENSERGWPQEWLAALAVKVSKKKLATEPWRFARKKDVQVGERVFLLRQGKKGHAILGYGHVNKLPNSKNEPTDVAFEALLNPTSGIVLATQDELHAMTNERGVWSTQSSGIALSDDIAHQLESLVVNRLPIPDVAVRASKQNPNWTRDELILALDLYFRVPDARGSKSHPECVKLSKILNELPIHRGNAHSDTFRNANGVGMKLSNFLQYDSTYSGKGLTSGSQLEKEIWDRYASKQKQLRQAAEAILDGAKELLGQGVTVNEVGEEGFEAAEGGILTVMHKIRERDSTITKKKKKIVLDRTGKLECEVCNFDFARHYGEVGLGFAECHHGRAVSTLKSGEKTKPSDLHIVCANCHRMLHRRKPWLSVDELRVQYKKKH